MFSWAVERLDTERKSSTDWAAELPEITVSEEVQRLGAGRSRSPELEEYRVWVGRALQNGAYPARLPTPRENLTCNLTNFEPLNNAFIGARKPQTGQGNHDMLG
jgi:hypothetical protein